MIWPYFKTEWNGQLRSGVYCCFYKSAQTTEIKHWLQTINKTDLQNYALTMTELMVQLYASNYPQQHKYKNNQKLKK